MAGRPQRAVRITLGTRGINCDTQLMRREDPEKSDYYGLFLSPINQDQMILLAPVRAGCDAACVRAASVLACCDAACVG